MIRPAQVDARLRRFKRTAFGGSEARYRARLRAIGMTDADVRRATRDELLVAALQRAIRRRSRNSYPFLMQQASLPAANG